MRNVRHTLPIILGLLLSTSGFADDAGNAASKEQRPATVDRSVQALQLVPRQTSRWQPLYDADSVRYPDKTSQPVANLDFEDSGTFARAGKIRALSLLTLAEINGARLFFGVNRKGLLGIHVRAVAPDGDDSCPELARMPYLADIRSVNYAR